MWWHKTRATPRRLTRLVTRLVTRLALVIAAAGLVAGCFEPLYGSRPSINSESVHDKLGAVEIKPIP